MGRANARPITGYAKLVIRLNERDGQDNSYREWRVAGNWTRLHAHRHQAFGNTGRQRPVHDLRAADWNFLRGAKFLGSSRRLSRARVGNEKR